MKKTIRVALPFFMLLLGVVIAVALVATKPKAKKTRLPAGGTPVEVVTVRPETRIIKVRAHGTVIPARQVVLSPEVTGRVTAMSSALVPGGRFAANQKIARIDPADYRLLVEQQRASVAQAATALEVEKGRKKIAERDWELMGGDKEEKKGSLALRDPQLKSAEVALKSAKSVLRRASRNIGKTILRAPFNSVVQARTIDVGQLVGPSTPAVTLAGTDHFWVQISIPVERLAWIDIPEYRGAKTGSAARIRRQVGDERIERTGRVIRLLGDLDPMGRMARLLVEIEDPLGLQFDSAGSSPGQVDGLPLLLGAFVEVEIEGHQVAHAVEIPRGALRFGDSVYVMKGTELALPTQLSDLLFWADTAEHPSLLTLQQLETRRVNVVWRLPKTVIVTEGLQDGDQLITSAVAAPVEGMRLRVLDSEVEKAQRRETAQVHHD